MLHSVEGAFVMLISTVILLLLESPSLGQIHQWRNFMLVVSGNSDKLWSYPSYHMPNWCTSLKCIRVTIHIFNSCKVFFTDQQGPVLDQLGIHTLDVHAHSQLLHWYMIVCLSSSFSDRCDKPTKIPLRREFPTSWKKIDQLVTVGLENSNCLQQMIKKPSFSQIKAVGLSDFSLNFAVLDITNIQLLGFHK